MSREQGQPSLADRSTTSLVAQLCMYRTGRYPPSSRAWLKRKYWGTTGGSAWTFAASDGRVLSRHAKVVIRLHVKVQGTVSPYDGNLVYWAQRLRTHPLLQTRLAALLKRQEGRCIHCGLLLIDQDRIEIDHIVPRPRRGRDNVTNLRALHRHCHDQRGIYDKDHPPEEPDEVNVSCPVLKPSGGGDPSA
jgi:RNA-directed DNA polymerase